MKTQRVEHEGPRIETGPVKFGDDWIGIFIRGDEAIGIATMLKQVTSVHLHEFLYQLADDLMACREADK
jgi:hypothetical protein